MPLTAAANRSVGSILFVLPYYGYGWSRKDTDEPFTTVMDALEPRPFYLQVKEVISDGQQLMGLTGAIIEPEHTFNGYWCACLLRRTDECDFTTHPGDYLVYIAKAALPINPAPYPQKALAQWIDSEQSEFCLCGYGTVAESVEWIQDLYRRVMDSRKRVKELIEEMESSPKPAPIIVVTKPDAVWRALNDSEEFLRAAPRWVGDLVRRPYSEAIQLPVFKEPFQEGCVYRPGFEEIFMMQDYLEYLREQIRLNPRGERWTGILRKRLEMLGRHVKARVCYVTLHRFAGGLIESCSIVLNPHDLSIVHWEIH